MSKASESLKERAAEARKRFSIIKNPVNHLEEAFIDNAPPDILDKLLLLHNDKLAVCDDPYSPPATASKAQVESGNVTLADGKKLKVSEGEKKVTWKVGTLFGLDEVEALVLWRQFWDGKVVGRTDYLEDDSEDVLEMVGDFYFLERQSVLAVFASLLHKADDDSSPIQDVCIQCLERVAKPNMPSRLLASFVKRTKQVLPDDVRSSPRLATKWAKALIREQKLLLEVVFLLFYGKVESRAGDLVDVLQTISTTDWGQHQESYAFFDAEASALGESLANLLTLVAIEVSQIEVVASSSFSVLGSETVENTLHDPATLKQIHQLVCDNLLARAPQRTAPIALAWTFVLSRITETYESTLAGGSMLPNSHLDFAETIVPALASGDAMLAADEAPLFRRLAEYVLSPACELFPRLQALFTSITVIPSRGRARGKGASNPNALGYLSIGRTLLSCLPLLLRLPFLGDLQLSAAIDTFALLFQLDDSHILSEDFWKSVGRSGEDVDMDTGLAADEVPLAEAEREYLEVASSRFPAALPPFFKLIRSLCGLSGPSPSEDSPIERSAQGTCAAAVLRYLGNLTSLTFAMPPPPALVPRSYEQLPSLDNEGPNLVRAVRPIQLTSSIAIPKGATGRLVSNPGQKPEVVCWQVAWSVWALVGDIIEECSGIRAHARVSRSGAAGDDVFGGPSQSESTADTNWLTQQLNIDLVSDILEITAAVTQNAALKRTDDIVAELSSDRPPSELVLAAFTILEKSVAYPGDLLSRPAQGSLRLVGALVWPFPDEVWSMLRGSKILFPALSKSRVWRQNESSVSIVQREKLVGRYPVTLAILEVIVVLWEHCRVSSLTRDGTAGQVHAEVLLRALAWVRDEVWASFSSWKYAQLEDKFRLAYKCAQIFSAIGREATHCALRSKPFDTVVPAAFDFFRTSFVSSATLTTLNPINYLLAATTVTVPALESDGRFLDAEALLWAINACLELTGCILHLRRSVTGAQPCLLEHLLMASPSREDECRSGLHALAHWALRPDLTGLRASRALAFLCSLSQDWPADWPSMLASYGNTDVFDEFLTKVLARATDGAVNPAQDIPDRSSAWQLLTAIADCQPSVGALLVDTKRKEVDGEVAKGLKGSALRKAVALVTSTSEPEYEPDSILASILAFLDTVCVHASEYKSALAECVQDRRLCDALAKILASVPPASLLNDSDAVGEIPDDTAKAACAGNLCRAYAARVMASFIRITAPAPSAEPSSDAQSAAVGALEQVLSDPTDRFQGLILGALSTPADPELQNTAVDHLHSEVEALDLEDYRNVPAPLRHDRLSRYGSSFVYDFEAVADRIASAAPSAELVSLERDLRAVNLNLSMVDSQMAVTRSWQQLLESFLPRAKVGTALRTALIAATKATATEERQGDFMISVQAERITILLTIFGATQTTPEETPAWILELLVTLRDLAVSETFPLGASLRRQEVVPWHRPYLRLLHLAVQRASRVSLDKADRITWQKAHHATATLYHAVVDATEIVFEMARGGSDQGLRADVAMCVALFAELLRHPLLPATAVHTYRIHDLCVPALTLLSTMDLDRGRPIFAEHIVRFCAALTRHPRLAEQLASEGIMALLLNTGITPVAEAGSIDPVVAEFPSEEAPLHRLWCSILTVVTSLTQILGGSEQFLNEASAFASLYAHQLVAAFSAASEETLSFASLKAMEVSAALLYSLVSHGKARSTAFDVGRMIVGPALVALQYVRHCLTHPQSTTTTLAADVTAPASFRAAGEKEVRGVAVTQILRVARNILLAVTAYTRAVTVLTAEAFEWPLELTVIWPTRSIVTGEPASMGTLFELAETSLDFLHGSSGSSQALKDEASQVLEATLVLAVAQLALWERRPSHPQVRNPARMRREMAELVPEVLELIDKASATGAGHSGSMGGLSRSTAAGALMDSSPAKKGKGRGFAQGSELMQMLALFVRDNLSATD